MLNRLLEDLDGRLTTSKLPWSSGRETRLSTNDYCSGKILFEPFDGFKPGQSFGKLNDAIKNGVTL